MDGIVVNDRISIGEAELSERFSRASGPGGQGVNTTDSRVELSFDVERSASIPDPIRARMLERLATRLVDGVLTVVASERREQLANRAVARARMAELLAEAAAPPPPARRRTKPSRGAVQRRLDEKKRRGELKRGRVGDW